MKIHFDDFGGRKFVLAEQGLIIASIALLIGKCSDVQFVILVLGILAAYGISNVNDPEKKNMNKSVPPTEK